MQSINGAWFEITPHAMQRAMDMTLDGEAISAALGNPRTMHPGHPGRENWTRDKVTAVVEAKDGYWAVITFLWATANGWATDTDTIRSRNGNVTAEQKRAMRHAIKARKRGTRR